VLITDHNVRETLAVCERAYIVSQGHLIAHGTPDEIAASGLPAATGGSSPAVG
jgi:lipopolysaccharide export system ATP-binding protein